jgi:hypothetical protein
VAALALATAAGTASAGQGPAQKTTGSVQLAGGYRQYLSYDAFATTPAKGSVNYTNWDYASSGSGVWVPASSFNMGFGVDSGPVVATYAQSVAAWTPVSATTDTFSGSGGCGCGWVSTFAGSLSGSVFNLSMTEISTSNPAETYAMSATGTVAADGSVSGSWSDNYAGGRSGSFVIDDIGHEIVHYVAPVAHASVSGHDAWFDYTVPNTDLAGTTVYFHVFDGGSSGVPNDHVYFGTSPSPTQEYPITSGNLTVFS